MSRELSQDEFEQLVSDKECRKLRDIVDSGCDVSHHIFTVLQCDDYRLIQSLNVVLDYIKKKDTRYMSNYHMQLIEGISLDSSMAYNRNVLRYFQDNDQLEEEEEGILYDRCVGIVSNLSYPIACRAFSIKYICMVAQKYPELSDEVLMILDVIDKDESPGIQSCIRHGRKALR